MPENQNGEFAVPELSPFEQKIAKEATAVVAQAKTGYNWSSVDALLSAELPVSATRCKKASGSGRAANVLTESNDKIVELYLVFCVQPYTIKQFVSVAKDRIGRFRNVRAVAIADKATGDWRVRGFVHRDDIDFADAVIAAFPAIKSDWTFEAAGPSAGVTEDDSAVASLDEDLFSDFCRQTVTTVEGVEVLLDDFALFVSDQGVALDRAVAADALASALSSQLLLFAGPSGTGKSTLARLLTSFFTHEESSAVVEARRQMIGPEDLAGFYSSLSGRFAFTVDTANLLALQDASARAMQLADVDELVFTPILLVEEANLSAIDGYLSPIIHGLSSPTAPYIRWALHALQSPVENQDESLSVPSTLLFGPYPRVFGTTNVDVTAKAPARKVSSRSCVILLEAESSLNAKAEAARLTVVPDSRGPSAPPAAVFMGSPDAARLQSDEAEIEEDLEAFDAIRLVAQGTEDLVLVSRRDIVRIANYMAYYRRLVPEPTSRTLAAENAFLHFILPNLPQAQFSAVIERLGSSSHLTPEDGVGGTLGGLLAARVERLRQVAAADPYPEALDFWSALS